MDERKQKLILGSLLHDIGKVIYRTGDNRDHCISGYEFLKENCGIKDKDILDSVRGQSVEDLRSQNYESDSLAYLTYLADNIVAVNDCGRQAEKGFEYTMPLASVYNILNGNHQSKVYQERRLIRDGINFPQEKKASDPSYYKEIVPILRDRLKNTELSTAYFQSLLELLENTLSYVPSSVNQYSDISLYDHMRLTAAFAVCIYDYLKENELYDYSLLFEESEKFYKQEAFYFVKLDLSGIQNFIYTVVKKNALKALRTRSFYLEILLEVVIDDILGRLELSRANLLYSGGGGAYLLLPNTEKARDTLKSSCQEVNHWLINLFNIQLYLAYAGTPCSAESFNYQINKEPEKIYQDLNRKISSCKLDRYSWDELKAFNFTHERSEMRECRICQRVDRLIAGEDLCEICDRIIRFSNDILEAKFFTVEKEIAEDRNSLPLPGERRLKAYIDEQSMQSAMKQENYIRAYRKNMAYLEENIATHIWVGDYAFRRELKLLSDEAEGISRLGVLRADVDNLGQMFISGLKKDQKSLGREVDLSRNLSLFFQYHINEILSKGYSSRPSKEFCLNINEEGRKLLIIYSGGDDIFLVGAWNDIIGAALDLVHAFNDYTLGSLTLSAGIGIYPKTYPIKNLAYEVGELEDAAKANVYQEDGHEKTKNSICIFDQEYVFSWKEFEEEVILQKFVDIRSYMAQVQDRGTAYLYRLLQLIRGIDA